MKPLRIQMQAFGPYARTANIDFRHLMGGSLFLIHGQTGAGKTSILDGICFSLFGTSSGSDRSSKGLRSDLSKPDLLTKASLEFSLGPDIYKVVRTPWQMRQKKRGTEIGEYDPTAELFKLDATCGFADLDQNESWQLVVSGVQKTDKRVIELLGMNEVQFRQVVVLPQGQFRKFLASDSKEREKLLETLFRTEKYSKLVEKLTQRAKTLRTDVDGKRNQLEAQLVSLEVKDIASLEESLSEAEKNIESLAKDAADIELRFRLASERRDRALLAAKLTSELGVVDEKRNMLSSRKAEISNSTRKLDEDRRSRPVLKLDSQVTSLEEELKQLGVDQSHETKKLAETRVTLHSANERGEKLDLLRPTIEILKIEREALGETWKNAKRLKSETETLAQSSRTLSALLEGLRKSEADLLQARTAKVVAETAIQNLNNQVSGLESLRAERKMKAADLAALNEDLASVLVAATQLEDADRRRQETELHLKQCRESLAKLKISHHLSQAALLARELSPGSACPVCGSSQHPQPAMAEQDGPSKETIDAAELAAQNAANDASARNAKLESAAHDLGRAKARLQRRFGAEPDLLPRAKQISEALAREIQDDDRKITLLIAAEKQLTLARDTLTAAEREVAVCEKRLDEASRARDLARESNAQIQGRLEELYSQVPAESRDIAILESRGLAIKARIEDFEKQTKAHEVERHDLSRNEAAAKAKLETLTVQINEKAKILSSRTAERSLLLAASGFKDLASCRTAGLPDSESRRLEQICRAFENEWAIVESRFFELKKELESQPDWAFERDTRIAEFELADRERSEYRALHLRNQDRIKNLSSARTRVTALSVEIKALEEKFKVVGKLAAVATGDDSHNLSRVNFPRFVLAARLEEILEQASHRLYKMSRGQFVLKRATSQEDGRRSSGLDLEVEDAFSGTRRPTSSLSGGEGFMASLCLALGLADVVQSRLGGVRLEAVFVDEGFGTLDSETLDLAMKTLSELQAGGRIVGVISHVPELREQIAHRLNVRKSHDGSHVSWT